jgi:hypothetical protein
MCEEMKKEIQKPITIIRQEFIDAISNDINNCNLPLFVIEPILRDVYLEIKTLSQKQYEMDKEEYEGKLKIGDVNEKEEKENGNK